MRTYIPFTILGLIAALGLFRAFQFQEPEPHASPRPPRPAQTSNAPTADAPAPEPPRPLSEIAREAAAKGLPAPPPVETASDQDRQNYMQALQRIDARQDPEGALLARRLMAAYHRAWRDHRSRDARTPREERRAEHLAEREAEQAEHRKRHPRPERDPARPVRPPLIPPPNLGDPVLTPPEPPR